MNSKIIPPRLVEIIKRVGYYPFFPLKDNRIKKKVLRNFINEKSYQVLPRRNQAKTISIVIPCYMHAKYLQETIKSIFAQTRLPDEIIFVDDASPDATNEILDEYFYSTNISFNENQTKITILKNVTNKGQAYSLNKGITAARSDLIMILNDDDILFTNAIETIIQLFNSHKDLFLIGCTCIPFTDAHTIDKRKILDLHKNQEIPLIIHSPKEVPSYCGPNEINMTHSACTFFKVSWEFVGGYYENKKSRVIPSSDRDFQLRINCIFPIGVSYEIPFVFWRADSSVDSGIYS